jgi:hypothetical protein
MSSKLICVQTYDLHDKKHTTNVSDDDNNNNNNNNNTSGPSSRSPDMPVLMLRDCPPKEWQKCYLLRLVINADVKGITELASQCYRVASDSGALPPYNTGEPNKDRAVCDEEFSLVIASGNRAHMLSFIFFCLWLVPQARLLLCPNSGRNGERILTSPKALAQLVNGYTVHGPDEKLTTTHKPLDDSFAYFLMAASPDVDSYTTLLQFVYSEWVSMQPWVDMDDYSNMGPDNPSQQIMTCVKQQEKHLEDMKQASKDQILLLRGSRNDKDDELLDTGRRLLLDSNGNKRLCLAPAENNSKHKDTNK